MAGAMDISHQDGLDIVLHRSDNSIILTHDLGALSSLTGVAVGRLSQVISGNLGAMELHVSGVLKLRREEITRCKESTSSTPSQGTVVEPKIRRNDFISRDSPRICEHNHTAERQLRIMHTPTFPRPMFSISREYKAKT
jgi:hypothetical protein